MEKLIYLAWGVAPADKAALATALGTAGARHVRLNLADADVAPAAKLRQSALQPAPDALFQVWVDSAIAQFRGPLDEAVGAASTRHAAYLVTESQPLLNTRYPAEPGARTAGFAQIAILRKPVRLDTAQWLDAWHNHHTTVAIETQSNFEYLQNVVTRSLTTEAPAIDAIVEECFPSAAMTDPFTFFDAPGDEAKFKRNLARMMESVGRFIDPGTIDVIPTSQYDFG
jgi:hypothetical protein